MDGGGLMSRHFLARKLAAGTACLALAAAPGLARAQPVSGLYIGLGVGPNFMQDEPIGGTNLNGQLTSRFKDTAFDMGVAAVGSVGWGFGNGLRVELEGDFRQNAIRRIRGAGTSGGDELKYGAMVNVLYDFDLGWPVVPYVGAGIGEQTVNWRNARAAGPDYFIRLQHEDMTFAYQGIVGAAYNLPVPGLAVTAEYRFQGASGHTVYGQYFAPGLAKPAETRLRDDFNHSLLVGIRFAFNAAPPPVPAAPPLQQAGPARTYQVFFDWDRTDLSDRARQVIAEAAAATTRMQVARIDVTGHADRSGTARHNQALSLHRAEAVAAELVGHGVPARAITVAGLGETRPLVATADGTREPRNRRVEIVMH